ncbi:hypothetical protein BDI4_570031 [Burkholderia diffusa]|nr:hypothetical protein BDI4_570031 [Burkholderia diffusa]
MIPSLNTALLAGLTLELAGMFALGCHWLVVRHRATRPGKPNTIVPLLPSVPRSPSMTAMTGKAVRHIRTTS